MTSKHIFMLSFLVTGNMIGAGILAMPISAGIAGFWPSMLMMLFFSLSMFFSGTVLAKEVNKKRDDTFNYPSLYEEHFGLVGKYLASLSNLIIFYGLLISYLVGASKIIVITFKIDSGFEPFILFTLFSLFTYIAVSSVQLIKKYNMLLMLSLWLAFFVLVYIGTSDINTTNFSHSDWKYLPIAIPMIIASFVFHSIIPTICRDAGWSDDIWKPIALGLLMGFIMNTLWLLVAIGVVPEFGHISLNEARLTGIPITLEMSKILQSELFLTIGTLFSIIAIATSYVSIGMSLKDFSKDILENSFNIYNKWILFSIAFFPPLIVSYLFADVFLKALNIVGGIGIVLLFGILPSIIYYRKSSSKLSIMIAIIFFIAFSITFLITLLQTFGMLHLYPAG